MSIKTALLAALLVLGSLVGASAQSSDHGKTVIIDGKGYTMPEKIYFMGIKDGCKKILDASQEYACDSSVEFLENQWSRLIQAGLGIAMARNLEQLQTEARYREFAKMAIITVADIGKKIETSYPVAWNSKPYDSIITVPKQQ